MSANALPTEDEILHQTLIVPSALPAILSLEEFTSMFPNTLRDHSQVPALYRALQYERALDTDHVRENIELETRRGERQKRELHRSLAKGEGNQEIDVDDPERKLLDPNEVKSLSEHATQFLQGQTTDYEAHNLSTIVPAMETAVSSLQSEILDQEAEVEQAQALLEASISDLSDLRYGRLSRPPLRKELLESLKDLASKSEDATRRIASNT